MKNRDVFTSLKKKVLPNDQLLDLKGGAEPNPDCAPGETKYICTVHYCFECLPVEGYICSTSSTAAEQLYWSYYPEAFSVGCEPAQNPD